VADARVSLRDQAGVVAYQTHTLEDGSFLIEDVAPGLYRIAVEARGFSQGHAIEVSVRPGAVESVPIALTVSAVSDYLVVSATRSERPISELQDSFSLLSSDLLQREHQTLVSESLRQVPGLIVAQTGGRGGLTSIFTRGGESDYTKVLVDGIPVNAPGGQFDFSSLTTENLDRIEVARGPRSALFGSDAMTGVVQLITRRGETETPEFELSGEGGSFDFHRETARLSGLARRFDYSASIGLQSIDGRFRNSDFLNRSLSGNFGFRISPSAQLRVISRWNDNTLGVPGPTGILFSDPDQRQKHRDVAVAAAFEWRTTPEWYQSARFIYSEFNTHNLDPATQDLRTPGTPLLPPNAFGDDFVFTFRDHEKRAGFQYQFIVATGHSNAVTGGFDAEKESGVFTDDFSRVAPDRNNLGLYIQDQFEWRERLSLNASLRIERNTAEVPADLRATLAALGSAAPTGDVGFGLSVNPKISSSLLLRKHREDAAVGATRLRASFGTGIKEARLDEAFSPSPFFLGNPSLDPERAKSFDIGLAQDFFGRRATVEVTYFDNRFRDQIAFLSDPITFGPITLPDGRLTNFVNLERASARGVEVTAATRPISRLNISGSYTFLSSELERASATNREVGLELLRRPRHSGTIQASWIASSFDVSIDGSFVGARRDFDPVTFLRFDAQNRPIFNDGYALVNLSGSYRLNRLVTAFARIGNLLNQDYQEILGFPAYRLNFTSGLRFRIGGGK
jgi:vitamin B12 transporter